MLDRLLARLSLSKLRKNQTMSAGLMTLRCKFQDHSTKKDPTGSSLISKRACLKVIQRKWKLSVNYHNYSSCREKKPMIVLSWTA